MTGNVLTALGVLDDEDVISNLLAYCVDHSPSFAAHFVSALLGRRWDDYDTVRAYTRKSLRGAGIPDLIVKARSGGQCDLVVIENKLMAEEGRDQTKRYADGFCGQNPRNRTRFANLEPIGEWDAPCLAFLTLFPWQEPEDCRFQHVRYEDVLSAIKPYERGQDVLADQLLHDLSAAYSAFYAGGRTDPGDLLMQKWSSNGDLDAGFLHFGEVFEGMPYPLGLKAGLIGRRSALGHPFYAAQILKDAWRSFDTAEEPGFNIHFESQFNILRHRFSFYLHYEIRDYRPWKQARKEIPEARLAEYAVAREQFKKYLAEVQPPGLVLRGRSNQVGEVDVELDERTSLAEFSEAVCSAIASIARVLDGFPLLR
jgi:hypothetical protein